MAKRTKAMIEADKEHPVAAYEKLEQEIEELRTENKSLRNAIRVYQAILLHEEQKEEKEDNGKKN